ncbi:hypothetical protein [Paraburkholderia sp. J41]|uniref:hypothetical protein n=1 Tax=Paraburkholderia sp. J41 TaxID=2805433 RepID=UPI002AC33CF4|nr:hypothetical protein [Paraburkholderia sp. J41]
MLSPSLLRDLRYTMIPHQLRGVAAGLAALDLEARHDGAHPLQLRADGNAVQYDTLLGYTRPVACVAAIHCRALLRFLGLEGDGDAALRAIEAHQRHYGDAGTMSDARDVSIDVFKDAHGSPLTRVPLCAVERYPEPRAVARAWAATCDFAAQPLALALRDPRLASGQMAPLLRRTFETLPELLERWFYERAVL